MKSIDKFVLVLVASLALLLAGCGGGSSTPAGPTPEEVAAMEAMQMRAMEQKADLEEAHEALTTALAATLNTQDALDAANDAHKSLTDAIAAAADVSAADKAKYENAASAAMDRIADAQKIFDAAEAERMAMEQEQQRMEEAAAAAAMAATAAKLYAGISEPTGDVTAPAVNDRAAAYNTGGTAILVSIGLPADTPAAATLSEDKKTTVAANHGWAGKRYTRTSPASDGVYEAVVYSNVEAPTQGRKFGGESVTESDNTRTYQYDLDNGALTNAQLTAAGAAARIVLTGVTRTAGTESYTLPTNNPQGQSVITVSGSYHGVSGTYSCATTAGTACTAAVAEKGFTLAGGTAGWTFKPANPEARVMDSADEDYASYGWWIHKAANDGAFTASVFVDVKGTVSDASGLNALNGTATYRGGAAGKYALSSSTGGTNDAGHFTARATLEANFTTASGDTVDNAITGTIDQFVGADGMSRDWTVKLNGSPITNDGVIGEATATDGTEWTIGGTAATDSGNWSGNLRNNGTDNVPQVATGTFSTNYGMAGKMVGAFGANLDD